MISIIKVWLKGKIYKNSFKYGQIIISLSISIKEIIKYKQISM